MMYLSVRFNRIKRGSYWARSIIGAGSVVSSDIPCEEVWAGNPARCIRKL